jgi:GNAT superfamily N-acetyltransferase
MFGLRAGKVPDPRRLPTLEELGRFDHVLARIPQSDAELVGAYERLGFRFITVDYVFERMASPAPRSKPAVAVRRISREPPPYVVSGFAMEGSRLAIDPVLRRRLPPGFWDAMIDNHCRRFADVCLCVGEAGTMSGFASCLRQPASLDLFLVTVHPDATGTGIGSALIAEAVTLAAETGQRLTTSVVSQNTDAMRFYIRNGFTPRCGDVILHYSRERA